MAEGVEARKQWNWSRAHRRRRTADHRLDQRSAHHQFTDTEDHAAGGATDGMIAIPDPLRRRRHHGGSTADSGAGARSRSKSCGAIGLRRCLPPSSVSSDVTASYPWIPPPRSALHRHRVRGDPRRHHLHRSRRRLRGPAADSRGARALHDSDGMGASRRSAGPTRCSRFRRLARRSHRPAPRADAHRHLVVALHRGDRLGVERDVAHRDRARCSAPARLARSRT